MGLCWMCADAGGCRVAMRRVNALMDRWISSRLCLRGTSDDEDEDNSEGEDDDEQTSQWMTATQQRLRKAWRCPPASSGS